MFNLPGFIKKRGGGIFLGFLLLMAMFPSFAWGKYWFQQKSTWNTPATNAAVNANSGNYVSDLNYNSGVMQLNVGAWTVPVYRATSSTPQVTVPVTDTSFVGNYQVQQGWNIVPLDPSWLPDNEWMTVISADGRWEWDFHSASKSNGSWSTYQVRKWDLTADGVNDPYDGHGHMRQASGPLLQGLLTYDEVVNGTIDHALCFGYYAEQLDDPGVYPSEFGSYVMGGLSSRQWAMPMGMRLRLKPSVNCNSFGFNSYGLKVCQALQTYGMILVATTAVGDNSVYAEANKPWSGLGINLSAIPVSYFEVIDPVYPSSDTTTPPPTDTTTLSAPEPVSPTSGSTTDTTVTFQWKKSNGKGVKYKLYLSNNSSFSGTTSISVASRANKNNAFAGSYAAGLLIFGIAMAGIRKKREILLFFIMACLCVGLIVSCGGGGSSGGGSTQSNSGTSPGDIASYSVSGLSSATQYYWKISATDDTGQTVESPVSTFVTQ